MSCLARPVSAATQPSRSETSVGILTVETVNGPFLGSAVYGRESIRRRPRQRVPGRGSPGGFVFRSRRGSPSGFGCATCRATASLSSPPLSRYFPGSLTLLVAGAESLPSAALPRYLSRYFGERLGARFVVESFPLATGGRCPVPEARGVQPAGSPGRTGFRFCAPWSYPSMPPRPSQPLKDRSVSARSMASTSTRGRLSASALNIAASHRTHRSRGNPLVAL